MKNKIIRLIWPIIACSFLTVPSDYVAADVGRCEQKEGYIKHESLISVIDLDCSDNQEDKLCSIMLGAPKIIEGRKFQLFTFLRQSNDQVKTYLNISPNYDEKERVMVRFDFEEASSQEIAVDVVYENVAGCTLKSRLKLGDLTDGRFKQALY